MSVINRKNGETCHHLRWVLARFFIALASVSATLVSAAPYTAPYTPDSDDQVLVTLSPAEQSLEAPHFITDESDAVRQARYLMDTARQQEDARFLSYARASLAPYLTPTRSASVDLLMAEIEQYQHQFDPARTRLMMLLERRPDEGQAWLMLANLDRVQGRFNAASAACRKAATSLPPSSIILCLASIQAMTEQLPQAWETLQRLAASEHLPLHETEQRWLYTLLAEMAVQQGESTLALRFLERALASSPQSPYLRYLQNDVWLMQNAYDKVIADLADWQDRDNALLRLSIAAQRSHHPDASRWQQRYQEKLKAEQQSQRPIHHREQARFLLSVLEQPTAALHAAQQNWKEQKELSDLRILLASAVQSQDSGARNQAVRFMEDNGVHDELSFSWLMLSRGRAQ